MGEECMYVASSDNSFRRHLIVHHGERWSVQRRGLHSYERFVQMSPREALEYRVALANRQGGRGRYRRQLIDQARRRGDVRLPPPPPVHRRRQMTAATVAATSMELSEQAVTSTSFPAQPLQAALPGGEHTDSDRELSDEIYDFDEGQVHQIYADLYQPELDRQYIRRVRGYATEDSDLEAAPPNDVMPPRHSLTSPSAVNMDTSTRAVNCEVISGRARTSCNRSRGRGLLRPEHLRPDGTLQQFRDSSRSTVMPAVGSAEEGAHSVGCQAAAEMCEAATDALPPLVRYNQATMTTTVERRDAAVEVAPQPIPVVRTTGTSTRPWPRPWLREPHTDIARIAGLAVRLGQQFRDVPVDRLTDRVTNMLGEFDVSSRRSVAMMVDYGGELLRQSAELILRETSARFGHLPDAPLREIIQFATDELGVWARRPMLSRTVNIDDQDDDPDNHWLR